MGAWGTGPFDNDDAGDWVYELEQAGDLGFVRETLTTAAEAGDYLEMPDGNNAVAAAAVVAAALDQSHDGLPEDVVAWLSATGEPATAPDARLGVRALDRVTGSSQRPPTSGRSRRPVPNGPPAWSGFAVGSRKPRPEPRGGVFAIRGRSACSWDKSASVARGRIFETSPECLHMRLREAGRHGRQG